MAQDPTYTAPDKTPDGELDTVSPDFESGETCPWSLHADAELVKKVTLEAGRIALHYFAREVKVWEKSPNNPVSEADLAVDTFLKTALMENRTGYGWLSEETIDRPERLRCGRLWIVDPIDGTRAFLNGSDDWGVSVALVQHGLPAIAAFYAPARNHFYFATHGGGATCNDKKISVSGQTDLARARMMGAPAAFRAEKTWPIVWPDSMTATGANSIALRLCMIADGQADCCVTLRPKNDWDVAAADLIVREAGGLVKTGTERPLVFNQERPQFDHIVASTPELMDDVMTRVKPALEVWHPDTHKP